MYYSCRRLRGRLWPLSRKNYPKQFLNLNGENSLFQETVTRNIPFCEEFYIVTNAEYRMIAESQLKQFQGISYRMILEEGGERNSVGSGVCGGACFT